jgi:hypothetical protein
MTPVMAVFSGSCSGKLALWFFVEVWLRQTITNQVCCQLKIPKSWLLTPALSNVSLSW